MHTVLSYASPDPTTSLRLRVGAAAAIVAACSSAFIVAAAFYTRYRLASFAHAGWCGTARLDLQLQLCFIPFLIFIPLIAVAVAHHVRASASVCRISTWFAAIGWVVCAFVG